MQIRKILTSFCVLSSRSYQINTDEQEVKTLSFEDASTGYTLLLESAAFKGSLRLLLDLKEERIGTAHIIKWLRVFQRTSTEQIK